MKCEDVTLEPTAHGYPDWFRFHVTKWHVLRSVPERSATAGDFADAA